MDVSPALLREVQFKEQRRGYNPDEVDDFLERLAVALGELQDRLAQTVERADAAEAAGEGSEGQDELRRTLVLAQRTADAALDDARRRGAEIVAGAEAEAAEAIRAGEDRAAGLIAAAEGRVATELAPLLAQRDALEGDVEALRSWFGTVRAGMADELRANLTSLEENRVALREPPEVVVLELPEPSTAPVAGSDHAGAGAGAAADPDPDADESAGRGADETADPDATSAYDALALDDDRDGAGAPRGDDHRGHEGGALAAAAVDDPYLAELRLAVTDDEPLGPREPGDQSDAARARPSNDDDTSPAGPGFRFRKRR